MTFVHLRCHTEYSICDSIHRIGPLLDQAAQDQMMALAITDHMNLFALVKFYRQALSRQIKPIIAADCVLREGDHAYGVSLYCQNATGYQNLKQLISLGYLEGQHNGTPTLSWQWLAQYHEGLLVLSGGMQGDVGQALLQGKGALAKEKIARWRACFGDRYYLEIQRVDLPEEQRYNEAVLALALAEQVPVVATHPNYFLSAADYEAHEARVCIQSGMVLADTRRPQAYRPTQYFKRQAEMSALFADLPLALANTVEIAKRCTVSLSFDQHYFPHYVADSPLSLPDYLKAQTTSWLSAYLAQHGQAGAPAWASAADYHARLDRELDVIIKMDFVSYFLVVADFIAWAKKQGIPVGPGRGSGAGSLVAFCLGITGLDPIEHGLLFERFLNPERVSLPDFDIDFCMDRRDEVIAYVAQHYGQDKVSQIITYGTMAAKAVVRDVGRVLSMPYGFVDQVAKLIPFEIGMTLEKALLDEPILSERYEAEAEVRTLIDLAMKLEGLVRNAGKHAGGVIIAPSPLSDFCPVYCEPDGSSLVTQFDKDDVESIGLVKFDFLGLRTLTIIDWAMQSIGEDWDISEIPLDDQATYEMIQTGETTAVFQLESRGMQDLIKRLAPDCFEDMTALVALFRPGPLQSGMVDDYIVRKNKQAVWDCPHPKLEPILTNTYGVILYQEQVMEIARVLGGYSLGAADILRRAMGKKKPEEMAKQRAVFLQGAKEQAVDETLAAYIFDLMEKFAGYGFNKSHSAAYALLAYQTAWLKTHHPAHFMAAVLSSDMDSTDKVLRFLSACRQAKVAVNLPDINVSRYAFYVSGEMTIEYGLGAVKGVGESAALAMVAERAARGPYESLFDFCYRLADKRLSKRTIEPLIYAGAMDSFGVPRGVLIAHLEDTVRQADQAIRNQSSGQSDLFSSEPVGNIEMALPQTGEELPPLTRLAYEKSTLGFYASGHPVTLYTPEFGTKTSGPLSGLRLKPKSHLVLLGMIAQIRPIQMKSGRKMAVITLEDQSGELELTVFSPLYETLMRERSVSEMVMVDALVEADRFTDRKRIKINQLETVDQYRQQHVASVHIVLSKAPTDEALAALSACLRGHHGLSGCPVWLDCQDEAAEEVVRLAVGKQFEPKPSAVLLAELRALSAVQQAQFIYPP
jgi:DNA polymerase-3 subunit alpha